MDTCIVPRPHRARGRRLDGLQRYQHAGLRAMDTRALLRKLRHARHQPIPDSCELPWRAERLAAIRAELRRRGGC